MVDAIGSRLASALDRATGVVARIDPAKASVGPETASRDVSNAVTARTIAKQMAQLPPVDVERVARIRKAIADGTFPIMPAKIADRMIALELNWRPNDKA